MPPAGASGPRGPAAPARSCSSPISAMPPADEDGRPAPRPWSCRQGARLRRPLGIESSGFLAAFGVDPDEDAPSHAAHAALAIRAAARRAAAEEPAATVRPALHADDPADEADAGRSLEARPRPGRPDGIVVSGRRAPSRRRFSLAPIDPHDPGLRLDGSPTTRARADGPRPRRAAPSAAFVSAAAPSSRPSQGRLARAEPGPVSRRHRGGAGSGQVPAAARVRPARFRAAGPGTVRRPRHATPYGPVAGGTREPLPQRGHGGPRAGGERPPGALGVWGSAADAPSAPSRPPCGPAAAHAFRAQPRSRAHRTFEALHRLFLALSLGAADVLAVEDLHWIDAETQAGSTASSRASRRPGCWLLANYRPEHRTPGEQDPRQPGAAGRVRAERAVSCSTRSSARSGAGTPQTLLVDDGQPVLPGGDRPDARQDEARWPASEAGIDDAAGPA